PKAAKPAQIAAAPKASPAPSAAPKVSATPPAAAEPAAASGAWRIQLGAFSQRGSAEALFQKLSAKPALAGRRPFYIPVGAITRLQAGPFESKAAATNACAALGVPCFPVPGN
ncbi:MAG TPA: SPOR domain-containing protein, partial [Sphingomicrobium sp.]|nr:SPOR domain-containing protein [Sphingomicrobium sp.]